MGNLLRVLYNRDDSPAKVDIFVDFESKILPFLFPSNSLYQLTEVFVKYGSLGNEDLFHQAATKLLVRRPDSILGIIKGGNQCITGPYKTICKFLLGPVTPRGRHFSELMGITSVWKDHGKSWKNHGIWFSKTAGNPAIIQWLLVNPAISNPPKIV